MGERGQREDDLKRGTYLAYLVQDLRRTGWCTYGRTARTFQIGGRYRVLALVVGARATVAIIAGLVIRKMID